MTEELCSWAERRISALPSPLTGRLTKAEAISRATPTSVASAGRNRPAALPLQDLALSASQPLSWNRTGRAGRVVRYRA